MNQPPPVLILAAFGVSDPEALEDLLNIKARVAAAWPRAETRLAFTSRVLRGQWRCRADEASFRASHPGVPAEIYEIKSPLTLLAEAQEEGPRPLVVQPLHVSAGEEYADLKNMTAALAGIETLRPDQRPFPLLHLARPALGDGGADDLERAARALRPLAEKAGRSGSALVLVGHGSRRLTSAVYGELEKILRRGGEPVHIGLLEGGPGPEEIIVALAGEHGRDHGPRPILLAPLLAAAGRHARDDLAGPEPDSWASRLRAAGHPVEIHLQGLGSLDAWADLYVEQVRQGLAALETGRFPAGTQSCLA